MAEIKEIPVTHYNLEGLDREEIRFISEGLHLKYNKLYSVFSKKLNSGVLEDIKYPQEEELDMLKIKKLINVIRNIIE